jgi:hypothetical protein
MINFAEGPMSPLVERGEIPLPPRDFSVFPPRCHIIDSELSIRFPEDNTPDHHCVTGLPLLCHGYDHPDDYRCEIALPMLLDTSHCPFRSDSAKRFCPISG